MIGAQIDLEDLEADPYPIYRYLRDEEPLAWVDAAGLWFVTRWEDCRTIALDSERFSGDTEPSTLNRTIGRSMMRADGSYHRAIRSLVDPPFQGRAVRDQMGAVISKHASRLVESFAADGEADLVAAFAQPLSVRVLRDVLGLHEVDEDRLAMWFDSFATGGANFEGDPEKQAYADRGSADADSVLMPLLRELAGDSDGSVLSSMLSGSVDGRSLTADEIAANVKLIILGGMQEPRDLIGMTLIALLQDPPLFELIRNDRTKLRAAIEESLRCFSPVGTLTRQTTRPVEIAGNELPKGAMVAAVIASANRDERQFPEPDRFDVDRRSSGHLAFGIGPHFCLGAALARLEATVALNALLDLPGLRLNPGKPPLVRGWEFRGPKTLHAHWETR